MVVETVLVESLSRAVGKKNLFTKREDLERYSTDALTPFRAYGAAPILQRIADVVVTPQSAQHVAEVVSLAAEHRVPVVPYGGGTGVMGGAVPVCGGKSSI